MKNSKLINLFYLLLFIIVGCKNFNSNDIKEKQLKCYNSYLNEVKSEKEYTEVRTAFLDSLSNWIENDIKGISYLKNKEWILDDAVFFNKRKDKALLMLLAIDKNPEVELASIKVVGGENINDSWHFYYQSYPILYRYRTKLDTSISKAFKELSEIGIEEISIDGYITKTKNGKCKINYDYINSEAWFADWMRNLHKDFLNSKW